MCWSGEAAKNAKVYVDFSQFMWFYAFLNQPSLSIPTLLSDIQSSRKFEMKKETCPPPSAKNFDKAEHSHIITDTDIKTRQIFQN